MKNKVPKLRFPEFSGEWEEKTIGSFMECIVPGRNKPQEFIGDIPWITTPDISGKNFVYSSKNKLSISKVEIKKMGTKIVPENSIIMSCVGDLGVICIAGTDIVINQQLHAFLPNSEINNIFVKNSLLTKISYMEKIATKTAVLYMNKDACNSIPILLPSLPEQEKIANFLSSVDIKIEKLEKKKELLEKYKKGMMQKLFSQKLRFKDENGNDYPEWEGKKLGEIIISKASSISNNSLENNEGNYAVYGAAGFIKNINFYEREQKYIGIIKDGAGVGRLLFCKEKTSVLATLQYLIPKKNDSLKFIYYLLNTIDFTKYMVGSSIPHIYFKDYSVEKKFIPSLPEQEKIANFLSSIDRKLELVEEELEKNKEFKKGLLQQMFV